MWQARQLQEQLADTQVLLSQWKIFSMLRQSWSLLKSAAKEEKRIRLTAQRASTSHLRPLRMTVRGVDVP